MPMWPDLTWLDLNCQPGPVFPTDSAPDSPVLARLGVCCGLTSDMCVFTVFCDSSEIKCMWLVYDVLMVPTSRMASSSVWDIGAGYTATVRGKNSVKQSLYAKEVLGRTLVSSHSDPGYMSRKIRKFRTDKFDTWHKRKFWLLQLMWTAGSQPFTWVAWVKISVCVTYRIYPFETFEFFCSCIRRQCEGGARQYTRSVGRARSNRSMYRMYEGRSRSFSRRVKGRSWSCADLRDSLV